MSPVWLRRGSWLAGFALLAGALLLLRLHLDGERELAASDRDFDRGDVVGALLHARRAATLAYPGARHVPLAEERLRAIARGAEERGRLALAETAIRALRGTALERRSAVPPDAALVAGAEEELVRLAARRSELNPATYREELKRSFAPSSLASALLIGGFAAVLLGAGALCTRALHPSGRLLVQRSWAPVLLASLGLLGWISGILAA